MMTITTALLVPIHSGFKSHKRLCKNHDYRDVKMSETHNKILKYNKDQRSMKYYIHYLRRYRIFV